MSEVSSTSAARPKATYSQGMLSGGFLFTAGFGPLDPVSGEIVGSTVQEQTRAALANIAAMLHAAGLTLRDVVKVTAYLHRLSEDFAAFQAEYEQHFEAPYPVRTTVGADLPGFLVEIDVVARVSDGSALPDDRATAEG